MNQFMLALALGKVVHGLLVSVVTVALGTHGLAKALKLGPVSDSLAQGNHAVAVLYVGSIGSLALLARHSVTAPFVALDLMLHTQETSWLLFMWFAIYATVHVGLALFIGAAAIGTAVLVFNALTRRVDELQLIREGKLAPALVLAAVMVATACLLAPGLASALDALLPMPALGRYVLPI